jgi:uncharacterized membrane protein (UPF0127 family)
LASLALVAGGVARQDIHIGHQTYHVRVATTLSAQARGLSGEYNMPSDEGMLFIFHQLGPQCMWMKDMQLPLDMLWLDRDKTVVHVERDVTPDSYPQNFCSPKPAQFVVELNAGEINRSGVSVGRQITF